MASLSYYVPYRKFQSSSSIFAGYLSLLEEESVRNTAASLSSATRCLAIGTNSGEWEIELIKRFMPKLQTLTAVEPDEVSAAELRKNIQRYLPSSVTGDVRVEKVQELIESGSSANLEPYDVVTVLQCLYHIPTADRSRLFSALHDRLLKPGGIVIVIHGSRHESPGSVLHIASLLETEGDESTLLTEEVVKSEMRSAGFKLLGENEYTFDFDFRNVDQELADIFSIWLGSSVSVQQLNEAVSKACPDAVSRGTYSILMWFQK